MVPRPARLRADGVRALRPGRVDDPGVAGGQPAQRQRRACAGASALRDRPDGGGARLARRLAARLRPRRGAALPRLLARRALGASAGGRGADVGGGGRGPRAGSHVQPAAQRDDRRGGDPVPGAARGRGGRAGALGGDQPLRRRAVPAPGRRLRGRARGARARDGGGGRGAGAHHLGRRRTRGRPRARLRGGFRGAGRRALGGRGGGADAGPRGPRPHRREPGAARPSGVRDGGGAAAARQGRGGAAAAGDPAPVADPSAAVRGL